LRGLGEAEVLRLLEQAARVRLENKAAQFRACAKNAGWGTGVMGEFISRARIQAQRFDCAKRIQSAIII